MNQTSNDEWKSSPDDALTSLDVRTLFIQWLEITVEYFICFMFPHLSCSPSFVALAHTHANSRTHTHTLTRTRTHAR